MCNKQLDYLKCLFTYPIYIYICKVDFLLLKLVRGFRNVHTVDREPARNRTFPELHPIFIDIINMGRFFYDATVAFYILLCYYYYICLVTEQTRIILLYAF